MSNSTFPRIGIKEGELRPGRSIEFARRPAEWSIEVSGVPGSDDAMVDGGADLLFERRSDVDEGVEGAVWVG